VLAQPPARSPAAPARQRVSAGKRETTKPRIVRKQTTKRAAKKSLPSLVRAEASSPDRMLLIGGLALFALVLCDTVFLTLSTRYLRGAG
jgi:hypothetical protein